jgi:hypothetical protein
MPVHYDGAENVTSPRQFPCGEQMPADHTGTLADVTCEGCKQTPLYKVAVAINNGREPSESDRAFGPQSALSWLEEGMTYGTDAQFWGTVRSLLDTLHGGELAQYVTDQGTLAAGGASADDLTWLAMLLGRAAGVLQARRDPRADDVHALSAEAAKLREARDDALASEAMAAGDPWADSENA